MVNGSEINGNSNVASSMSNDSFSIQPKHPEWDCLLIACQKGDASMARRILKSCPASKLHTNPLGQSALHIAAWWNRTKCVDLLLQCDANPHAANSLTGATPLHECLQSNNIHRSKEQRLRRIKCVSLLLKAKADSQSLDKLGRTPLECFVLVNKDDIRDRLEIQKLIVDNERARNNPLRSLLQKLKTKETTPDEIGQLWFETVVPALDIRPSFALLLAEFLSTTEAWTDRAEKPDKSAAHAFVAPLDVVDNRHFLGCTTWMWNSLIEISTRSGTKYTGDETSTPGMNLGSARQTTFSRLARAIFNRYEHLYRTKKNSLKESPSTSILQDDVTIYCWTDLAVLLLQERDFVADPDVSCSSKGRTDTDNFIHQSWMTIARRNYFDLAELWWNRFKISPIGVVNRQGMTALQFAARSGHFRMVEWLIGHPSLRNDKNILVNWIKHQDHMGHSALAAAKVNQQEEIASILHDNTEST